MQEGLSGHGLHEGDDTSSRSSRAFALARRRVWESARDNDKVDAYNQEQQLQKNETRSSSAKPRPFTVTADDIQETITFAQAQNSPSPAALPSYPNKRFGGHDTSVKIHRADRYREQQTLNGPAILRTDNLFDQNMPHNRDDSHVSSMAARFNTIGSQENSNSAHTNIVGSPISRQKSDRVNVESERLRLPALSKPTLRGYQGSIVASQSSDASWKSGSTVKDSRQLDSQGGPTDYDISSIPISRKRPFAERKSILERYTKSVEARRLKPDISAFERTKRVLQNLEMSRDHLPDPLEPPPSPRSVLKSLASASTPSHTPSKQGAEELPSSPSLFPPELKTEGNDNDKNESQATDDNAVSELKFSDPSDLSKLPLSERLVREVQGLYLYQRSTREDLDRLEAKIEQLMVVNNNNGYNVSSTAATFVRKSDLLFCVAWCILVIVCAVIFSTVILGGSNTRFGVDYGYSRYYPGTS